VEVEPTPEEESELAREQRMKAAEMELNAVIHTVTLDGEEEENIDNENKK